METTTKRQTPRRRKHKSNNFRYYVSEGFKGLFSHGFMSAAAIIIIAACLLVLGVLLGTIRQRTGRVWPGWVLHTVNNLLVFAAG